VLETEETPREVTGEPAKCRAAEAKEKGRLIIHDMFL
jgi:hypothetical protein